MTHDTDPAATLWRAATMVSGTGRIQPSSGHRQHSQLGSEECQPPVSPHHEWLMVASTSTVCTHSPATRSGQLKMFKKTAVEKRLRKISKQEAASVKLLEKQVDVDRVR